MKVFENVERFERPWAVDDRLCIFDVLKKQITDLSEARPYRGAWLKVFEKARAADDTRTASYNPRRSASGAVKFDQSFVSGKPSYYWMVT